MATLQMYMDKSRIENTFESSVYQEVWGEGFGVDNSVGKIKKILVHCPGEELLQLEGGRYEEEADARILTDEKGRIRNYFKDRELPNIAKMKEQHDNMTDILRKEGVEVFYFEDPTKFWTNLTFTRDIALLTPKGVILNRFAISSVLPIKSKIFCSADSFFLLWMSSTSRPPYNPIYPAFWNMANSSFVITPASCAVSARS